ncbi:TRAP transporter large permease subunit [Sneathiella sp. P13V-1]|uniref:TRAP transporter large permease n=1 Tax=Sneathiella sp. P13V-1 TaxID=2697366 RepID=UPI00187B414C|nr:TRAP transporter large permease subunit [Sneathiella sp. P13V-1]MBE7636893.1 TRAP transporter large permease subunit [Sneathiella sp. P13V-1]
MLFGLDGVEISLIIVAVSLFGGILSGYPVAYAISGSAFVSFVLIAGFNEIGWLYTLQEIGGEMKKVPVFERGWEHAMLTTESTWAQGVFSRAFGGNVETLLAVPLFVLMGIALERSNIAEDLLTTMAKLFGSMPGGLAISVVLVGTLLAASTGVVGATVVTMGLIALPTMLKHGYSKSLATGVIATSGTLGQIIPPSIVIVLLGSIVGDMYSIGQENRAAELGVTVLEMLGEPAVLSTGTLFKAAFIPGVMLASLYALYALGFALLNRDQAPPVHLEDPDSYGLLSYYKNNPLLLVGAVILPLITLVVLWIVFGVSGVIGEAEVNGAVEYGPISGGTFSLLVITTYITILGFVLRPGEAKLPIIVGLAGSLLLFIIDWNYVGGNASGGAKLLWYIIPAAMIVYGMKAALTRLVEIEVLRVVSPPVILIVAVLGSILGGITNPTAAAALGAAGAIMLAANRRLKETNRSTAVVIWASLAIIMMLLMRGNFDLRLTIEDITFSDRVGIVIAMISYHIAAFGLLYSCWVLIKEKVMHAIVYETTKVTSMVFVILVASLFLSLTLRAFGGEHYIQEFLQSFEDPRTLLIVVMVVLFLLGFVLDFIEIIFIVIPIVGPVIYAADPTLMPPTWITILIAVNLQTSFITPPFGFALFYLRGVAPSNVTTMDIYRGVVPFVIIQVIGLTLLWFFPSITTFLPELLPAN